MKKKQESKDFSLVVFTDWQLHLEDIFEKIKLEEFEEHLHAFSNLYFEVLQWLYRIFLRDYPLKR
mgnify:CR=1 FL=1